MIRRRSATTSAGPQESLANVDDPNALHTVTVTWGEETFRVQEFTSVRVGPFSITATVGPNETCTEVIHRVLHELRAVAEAERIRKIASYKKQLENMGDQK